jgi:predicted DsbA family dithiol-disulfide isomerase
MKKIALVLLLPLFLFGCASVEEMAERRTEENSKASKVFQDHEGPLHVVGFFSMSSEKSSNVPTLVEKMKKKFKGDVEMEYRRSWEDRASMLADEASECARNQESFKPFLDIYFSDYFEEYDRDTMLEIALQLELDIDLFEECLDSGLMKDRVFRDKSLAERYNVKQVPSFVIEQSITISQSLDEDKFEKAIIELLDTLR